MKKIDNYEVKNNEITITNGTKDTKDRPALQLDVEYYQSYLDDEDMPDSQKKELIETIWNIVVSFVDLGFGIEPVQLAIQAGQNDTQDMIRSTPKSVNDRAQDVKIENAKNGGCP